MNSDNNARTDNAAQLQQFLHLLRSGRKQEADDHLRSVLNTAPSKAGPYALLVGGMLAQNGQYKDAVPLYQEAIRVNPGEPAAYFYLGVAQHALKNDAACDKAWDHLAERFPDHALTHYQLALRQLKRDELGAARESLLAAIERLEANHPLRADAAKTIEAIDQRRDLQMT